jgi:hypothetical protein
MLLIALYQLRPCALLLAGNNLLVARALSGFERWGQAAHASYIPSYVFSIDNLNTAAVLMAISLASLVGISTVSRNAHARIGSETPGVPRWALVAIGAYLIALLGARSSILTGGYAGEADIRYNLELAGGHVLILSLLLYELIRRRLLSTISAGRAFLVMLVVGLTQYSKGVVGITTGYLIVSAIILVPHTNSPKRFGNMARICVLILAVVSLSSLVRGTRAALHEGGADAVKTFFEGALGTKDAFQDENSGNVETSTNAGQSATHMLMCIALYDSGVSREWRSIYDVVEYTFLPSVVAEHFGWQRSINAPWELADHFIHGGGINILGELYWNGGYLCAVLMILAITFFCFQVDTRYRAGPFWLMMMSQFAPTFLMGYGYGFAQISRGAINALVVVVAYTILKGFMVQVPKISQEARC